MTAPLLLNATEAASYLGASKRTFRRWVTAGVIPVWHDPDTGTKWFSRTALDAWAQSLDDRDREAS